MNTWKNLPTNTDFSLDNLPFGIFSTSRRTPRVGVAIGAEIIDLAALGSIGLLEDLSLDGDLFYRHALNDFIATGKQNTNAVRTHLRELLTAENSSLREYPSLFVQQDNARMHLPVEVGNYTDFYSSIEHATNVGKMFRDPENALLPNWRHLPVGYHGRASSIVVSGTDIYRPSGQQKSDQGPPTFGPSRLLDFELEIGFIIGKENSLGHPISTEEAEDYIFGLVLFNDWSARDIQKWEYVPLGPFLGKSFASSISPWIIPLEALDPFRIDGPVQRPSVLPYLQYHGKKNYDVELEVWLQPKDGPMSMISKTNFKYMYWNMCQQLAHHTSNGCNVRIGDIMASGTISGPTSDSYGSMLELSWAGTNPVKLVDGSSRKFLQDFDHVVMKGRASDKNICVGFGSVEGQVLPSVKSFRAHHV